MLQRCCRSCQHVETTDNNLVYVHDLRADHSESSAMGAGADQIKDPTLPRAVGVECNLCKHDEAVFFQKPVRGDEGMKLIFMCTNCAFRWEQ